MTQYFCTFIEQHVVGVQEIMNKGYENNPDLILVGYSHLDEGLVVFSADCQFET